MPSEAEKLLDIDLPYANFGVLLNGDDVAIKAPPIAGWMVGKHKMEIVRWVANKGGRVRFRPLNKVDK